MRTLRITALLITAVVVACSAEKNTFSNGSGGNASASVTTDDSTGTSLGGNFSTGAGGGEETFGCSADLRYVVDGEGGVAKDCWPNQGCSAGECVDPCQAAADSKGNIGCEFVLSTPHFYVGIQPPCFTAFVANAWPRSAKLAVSRAGQSYDATQFGRIAQADPNVAGWATIPATGVPESKVGVLFLSHDPSSVNGGPLTCPVAPALSQDGGSAVAGSGIGQAWKIVSDTPISLYDILPYGGAKSYLPSAEVVLPTTAWGTNYIAVLPKDSQGPPWGQLVAAENNTAIELLATTALPHLPRSVAHRGQRRLLRALLLLRCCEPRRRRSHQSQQTNCIAATNHQVRNGNSIFRIEFVSSADFLPIETTTSCCENLLFLRRHNL